MAIETGSPYLSEHEAPRTGVESSKVGYNPSEEEKDAIRIVERLYQRAKKHRAKYDVKWMDFYRMFRGKQWKELRPAYRHSEVLNLVFQTIESMVPVLTDSKPKLQFNPTVPTDPELTDILNKVAENDWEHNDWLNVLTEIIYDSHFYGTGFGKCGYDPDANMGIGNIIFESHDPFNAFPDPNAWDVNDRRGRFYIDAEPVDVDILKKEYPDKAQWLESDVMELEKGDKTDVTQTFFKSPVDSKMYMEGSGVGDTADRNQCLKITCYFKDESVYEEELKKDEPNEGLENGQVLQKLKYPRGRKIVVASGVLLEDGENGFDDGKFPYIKLNNYLLPREFWGMGEVEAIEGPQKTINKLISFALDYMTLMGNPIWVVGDTANIDTDNLINKPGLIVETADINAVRREEGVQLPAFILQLVDRYKQYIDGISGQTDLSRGASSSVTAASAITQLQEAQQTRLRLKSRQVDKFLSQFGEMYMNRVLQYYSLPRIIRVTGGDKAQKYFHFHIERLTDELGNEHKIANITDCDDSAAQCKKFEIMGDFDVRVTTGSSLPFAKDQRSGLAMNLYKLGVIDDEELLKNVDYPNYEEVLRRNEEKKQAMAQMQMQQQQQGMQAQQQAQMQGAQQEAQLKLAMQEKELQAKAELEAIKKIP